MSLAKRQDGRYYTIGNPFTHKAFLQWAGNAGLPYSTVLEPFAGGNGLVHHLQDMGLCGAYRSYDLQPGCDEVEVADTLKEFPAGYEVCVTNPPWLARNVAKRIGMPFPDCLYQDLYAHALDKCLANCVWVAALVPESFLRAGLFRGRLQEFVSLTSAMFKDTGHPVGLALFGPDEVADTMIWSGQRKVGMLKEIEAMRPCPVSSGTRVRFNDPKGNVGLLALDNNREASIRFCKPAELGGYRIDHSRRSVTRLRVEGPVRIEKWNRAIRAYRAITQDVLMTPYRGLRKDGMYRRRCDWQLARGIIQWHS